MELLVSFIQKQHSHSGFLEFTFPELQSLFEMENLSYKIDPDFTYDIKNSPVLLIKFAEKYNFIHFERIISRSILTKSFIKVKI